MTRLPIVAHSLRALDQTIAKLRSRRRRIALVPTMGALHDGHISLVRLAQRRADRVIVSIFVNPAQFAPHEDFTTYPRSLEADRQRLAPLDVDLVWAPSAELMYPAGFATRIVPEGAALAGLEDRFRPHFFAGVATVVAKLFAQCRPDIAVFGEKDYQQLRVVSRLAADLAFGVKVIGGHTLRERDGLAMSSRNVYLSADERIRAPALHAALTVCAKAIAAGGDIATALTAGRHQIAEAGFVLDYLEARHADTLAPVAAPADGPVRLLAAARLGKTRLIDNIGIPATRARASADRGGRL
jgi:pantoate--beta-alanine ligase